MLNPTKHNGEKIINSSKNVDENGEALVVWHGGGFGQSEESYVWDAEGSGGWFSTTKDYAKGYMRTEEGEPTPLSFEECKEKNGSVSSSVKKDRTTQDGLTKNLVEEIFGGIWIEDKKEFAKFASAVRNYGIEENGEGGHLYRQFLLCVLPQHQWRCNPLRFCIFEQPRKPRCSLQS